MKRHRERKRERAKKSSARNDKEGFQAFLITYFNKITTQTRNQPFHCLRTIKQTYTYNSVSQCSQTHKHSKYTVTPAYTKFYKSFVQTLPNEICDDEELSKAVDDADGPALYHHRLGGLVHKEICYTVPHLSSTP